MAVAAGAGLLAPARPAQRGLYYAMWRQQIGERESGAEIERRSQAARQGTPDERDELSLV